MLRNILIVDDEKFIRLGLKKIIEQSGIGSFQVTLARNGQEAVEHLEAHPVDMVFTDINMPLLNGIDFIRMLHGMKHPPIVVIISGYNDFQYAVEGMRNGAVDYLLKPIDDAQILELLKKYLNWGEKTQDTDIDQLLVQDLRYASVSTEIAWETERELLRRICHQLHSDAVMLLYLRGNSEFFNANLGNELQKEFGRNFILVDGVGKWRMILAPSTPVFLRATDEGISYWAGALAIDRDVHFYQNCAQAKNLAKKGFLLGRRLMVAGEDLLQTETIALDIDACVSALCMGQTEAMRRIVERKWNEQGRMRMSAEAFEAQLMEFFQKVQQTCPRVFKKFEMLSHRLDDYLSFSSWQAFICEFWGYTYLLANAIKEEGMGHYSQSLKEALQYIDSHYMQDINLAMVANHVSVNYSVLSKEFKEQVGINFVNYLKKRRIAEAKQLLLTTNLNSNAIGRTVGFFNERQYVKVFRDLTGLTPTEFRRLHPDDTDLQ